MDLEQRRQRLRDASSETTVCRLAFVGLTSDLLQSLDDGGSQTSSELAGRAGSDPAYTERWLDAAYAFELVDVDESDWALTELGRAFLPDVPGTLMPLAIQSVLSARLADRLSELVETGEQPGEDLLGEFENVTPWFGPMLEAKFRPYFEEHVSPELEALEVLDDGRALDLGCGNGWYLRALAAEYPSLSGVGIDAMEVSLKDARRGASAAGLSGCLEFRRADIFTYRPEARFDLVALNRTLHHLWQRREEVFATVDAALADDGRLVVWEPAWPEDRRALREPERRMLGTRNLAEHAMGNRLLVPSEIVKALEAYGFEVDIRRLDAIETLFIARRD